jgi:hypothetical protein
MRFSCSDFVESWRRRSMRSRGNLPGNCLVDRGSRDHLFAGFIFAVGSGPISWIAKPGLGPNRSRHPGALCDGAYTFLSSVLLSRQQSESRASVRNECGGTTSFFFCADGVAGGFSRHSMHRKPMDPTEEEIADAFDGR